MSPKVCAGCGFTPSDEARFCPRCGHSLTRSPLEPTAGPARRDQPKLGLVAGRPSGAPSPSVEAKVREATPAVENQGGDLAQATRVDAPAADASVASLVETDGGELQLADVIEMEPEAPTARLPEPSPSGPRSVNRPAPAAAAAPRFAVSRSRARPTLLRVAIPGALVGVVAATAIVYFTVSKHEERSGADEERAAQPVEASGETDKKLVEPAAVAALPAAAAVAKTADAVSAPAPGAGSKIAQDATTNSPAAAVVDKTEPDAGANPAVAARSLAAAAVAESPREVKLDARAARARAKAEAREKEKADAEARAAAKEKARTEAREKARADAQAEADARAAKAKAKADAKAEAREKAGAEAAARAAAKAKSKADAKAEAHAQAEGRASDNAKAKADAKLEAQGRTDARAAKKAAAPAPPTAVEEATSSARATKSAPAGGGAASQADVDSLLKTGRQKLAAGSAAAALVDFKKARDADGRNADAHAGVGECSFEMGDLRQATSALRKAVRLSPTRPRYHVLLGQVYYKDSRYDLAASECQRALDDDSGNREAKQCLDAAKRKAGK